MAMLLSLSLHYCRASRCTFQMPFALNHIYFFLYFGLFFFAGRPGARLIEDGFLRNFRINSF